VCAKTTPALLFLFGLVTGTTRCHHEALGFTLQISEQAELLEHSRPSHIVGKANDVDFVTFLWRHAGVVSTTSQNLAEVFATVLVSSLL
jgi:hypothetical protein